MSNWLSNEFDNQLNVCIHDTTGCQTSCTTQFDNRLNEQWLLIQHGCQTGLTTGWMFVYTIQPVVEPAVTCKRGLIVFQLTQLADSKFQLSITVFENSYFLTFSLNLFLNSLWSCPLLSHSSGQKNNSGLISYFLLTTLKVSIIDHTSHSSSF